MAEDYEPSLLYESSSITPHGHEFYFVNHNPSQRIYVLVEPPSSIPTPSSSSNTPPPPPISQPLTSDSDSDNSPLYDTISKTFPLPLHESEKCTVTVNNENIQPLLSALTSHLKSLYHLHPTTTTSLNNNSKRIAFTLSPTSKTFGDIHPPPALSDNAIWNSPDVDKIPLSAVKLLETREIRPNVRIARLKTSGERCIFKSVEFKGDAVGLSFEVSNYKRLIGQGVGGWIPRLLAVVYVRDVEDEDDDGEEIGFKEEEGLIDEEEETEIDGGGNREKKEREEERNKMLHDAKTHFVGAAFEFFAQKDLTQHYVGASQKVKLEWTRQLVYAIAALEGADFEHWDLKCENLVLDTTTPHQPSSTANNSGGGSRRRSSVSHHPTDDDPGRIKVIDLENSKASSAWKVGEKSISMVYSMGKTVLEMFEERMPDVGDVKEEELERLPEPARSIVEMCCCHGEDVPTAKEVKEMMDGMLKK